MDMQILHSGITIGTVLGLLGGGLGVSIVAQVIKRTVGLSSPKVIHTVVVALSIAGTVLADAVSAIHGNAALLGSHAVGLLGVANAAHTFVVSDADQFVQKVQAALSNQSANQPSSQTATKSATFSASISVPPVPPPPTPPTEASF